MTDSIYEILYYKRTNKVHKSKGVSKLDGVLILQPQKGTVILRSAEDDTSDSSNDEEEHRRSKHGSNKQQFKKQSSSSTIYSGINPTIANRILEEDETFPLGAFEVQIIASKTGIIKNKPRGSGVLGSSLGQAKTLSKKILVKSKISRPISKPRAVLPQKRPPPQNPLTNRTKPLQPIARNSTRTFATSKQPLQNTVGRTFINQNILHESISHVPLTASIRNALRPHQVSGIEFLWKSLTGDRKGALLADEVRDAHERC